LVALLSTLILEESLVMFRGWTISVRDQLYLTGSQLHNMADDTAEPQAPAAAATAGAAATTATTTTTTTSTADDTIDAQESTETVVERDAAAEKAEKAETEQPLLARSSRWSWRGEEGEELDSPYDSSDASEFVKMPRNVGKAPSRSNFFQEGSALNHHLSLNNHEDEVSGSSSSVRNSNGSLVDDDQIAGRTRFRRSQRLQASRGSQEDYRLE